MSAASPDTPAILRELESLGTEQTRKTYRRHGVAGEMYGVSYGDLGKLRKRIKADHALARGLWASGVHDARVLATMIAEPERMDDAELDAWAGAARDQVIADAVAGVASRAPGGARKAAEWRRSDDEWVGRLGWSVLSHLANSAPPDALDEEELAGHLELIEREIHDRKNRVREAMNTALIAIGVRSAALETRALAAAARIGPVAVDHGDTACKTPDAAAYIRKTVEYRRGRAAAGLGAAGRPRGRRS